MVLPLVNLMKDQVDKLEKMQGVVEGKISIVYARPEAGDDFRCFAVCDWLYLS